MEVLCQTRVSVSDTTEVSHDGSSLETTNFPLSFTGTFHVFLNALPCTLARDSVMIATVVNSTARDDL